MKRASFLGGLKRNKTISSTFRKIEAGDQFGDRNFLTSIPTVTSVVTIEYCDLFYIEDHEFLSVLEAYPEIKPAVSSNSNAFAEKLKEGIDISEMYEMTKTSRFSTNTVKRRTKSRLSRMDEVEEDPSFFSLSVILPFCPFKERWDLCSAVCLMYYLFVIPFRCAFWEEIYTLDFLWLGVDWMVDLFFMVDIFYRARRFAIFDYSNKYNHIVANPQLLSLRYVGVHLFAWKIRAGLGRRGSVNQVAPWSMKDSRGGMRVCMHVVKNHVFMRK